MEECITVSILIIRNKAFNLYLRCYLVHNETLGNKMCHTFLFKKQKTYMHVYKCQCKHECEFGHPQKPGAEN